MSTAIIDTTQSGRSLAATPLFAGIPVSRITMRSGLPIIARFEERDDGRIICRARIDLEAEWEYRPMIDDTIDAVTMCAGKLQRAIDGMANVSDQPPAKEGLCK